MKNNMKNNLDEIVKKALNVAEKTGNFVIEQAPLVLQEFYNWHICLNILGVILGLILCFAGYRLPFVFLTNKIKDNVYQEKYFDRYSDISFFAWVSFFIGNIFGCILFLKSIYNLIFMLVAPKLYLIEYFIK